MVKTRRDIGGRFLAWGMVRSKPASSSIADWCRQLSSLRGAPEQRKSARGTVATKPRQALHDAILTDPLQWLDNRSNKTSKYPDLIHSTAKEPFLFDSSVQAWMQGRPQHPDLAGSCAATIGATPERLAKDEICSFGVQQSLKQVCDEGGLKDIVDVLDLYAQRGSPVPATLLYNALVRCIAENNIVLGRRIHALTCKCGHNSNTFLANHIIRMYASHGMLEEATQVFTSLSVPDTFSWCFIIKAHVAQGQCKQAIDLFWKMQQAGVKRNNHTFVAVLKACAGAADLAAGKRVHADILGSDIETDIFVGNSLVDMYSKCGGLTDARSVFDTLHMRDEVTWNAMIGGYAKQGQGEEALSLYAEMRRQGAVPGSRVIFLCLLKACSSAGALQTGKEIHSQIRDAGYEADVFVGSTLVDMYARCGSLEDARRVFDSLEAKNVVTWNCLISGYVQQGRSQEALTLYRSMSLGEYCAFVADSVTYVALLKACGDLGALHEGKQLHADVERKGLKADVFVGNCLVDMYAKCGSLVDARKVFDGLPLKDVVTWNTMIAGYVQEGMTQEALAVYASMQQQGVTRADRVTFVGLLQACSSDGLLEIGREVHAQIQERGLGGDVFVGSSLVDMYSKCGSLEDARKVFDGLASRTVVTWNSMMSAYVQQGLGQEALELYKSMQQSGIIPADAVTYVCLLKACGCAGAMHQGKQLHAELKRSGLAAHEFIGNCLVDMYAKCASLDAARDVFDSLEEKTVVTWNCLLNGYAQHSSGQLAIRCFEDMQEQNVEPDSVTFNCLLVACSHEGLVDEGRRYFRMMQEKYSIAPDVYHYTCMVDLLGRSGQLKAAEELVLQAPVAPHQSDVGVWTSLLSACKSHGNVDLGKRCFERIVGLEPKNSSAHVLMTGIYANAGMWSDADRIERQRRTSGAVKKPAKATIEVQHKVHTFTVGEARDDIASKMRSVNVRLVKEGGHVPHTQVVLKAVSDEDKEDVLCGHAEKLALAYGLLNTPDGTTLLVTKNLRMCSDCHSGTTVMSRVEKREIIVRDAHRVHRFAHGACSCGDRH